MTETSDEHIPPGFDSVWRGIWRARLLIVLLGLLGAALGVTVGALIHRKYEATTVVAAVEPDEGTGALGSLAARFGGLASLAGVNLPTNGNKKEEALAVLQSEVLTERYIRENALLPILYASQWDAAAGKWKHTDPDSIPTMWKANRLFRTKIRDVNEDKRTGMVSLTIRWTDPKVAAKWANDLVTLTNNYLRAKAIDEAERNISYLNEQAAKTNVIEARRAIYSLLEQELNKEMLARGRAEYALSVVDPAFAPERPASPGMAVLGVVGLLIGVFVGVMAVFWRRLLVIG